MHTHAILVLINRYSILWNIIFSRTKGSNFQNNSLSNCPPTPSTKIFPKYAITLNFSFSAPLNTIWMIVCKMNAFLRFQKSQIPPQIFTKNLPKFLKFALHYMFLKVQMTALTLQVICKYPVVTLHVICKYFPKFSKTPLSYDRFPVLAKFTRCRRYNTL